MTDDHSSSRSVRSAHADRVATVTAPTLPNRDTSVASTAPLSIALALTHASVWETDSQLAQRFSIANRWAPHPSVLPRLWLRLEQTVDHSLSVPAEAAHSDQDGDCYNQARCADEKE